VIFVHYTQKFKNGGGLNLEVVFLQFMRKRVSRKGGGIFPLRFYSLCATIDSAQNTGLKHEWEGITNVKQHKSRQHKA
jgi:hypothetical protein